MAQLKHSQGKTEEMYRKSLACNEEVLGLNHVETLANLMQIVDLRAEQKDFRGAQFMYCMNVGWPGTSWCWGRTTA
jgi:hypothetical protein